LRDYAGHVWLFTSEPAVDWTNNVSEQSAKAAKRHQAVSGYRHTQATLARWRRNRSYLDSAATHGITALDAITANLVGTRWLPLHARRGSSLKLQLTRIAEWTPGY
jgi:transposase